MGDRIRFTEEFIKRLVMRGFYPKLGTLDDCRKVFKDKIENESIVLPHPSNALQKLCFISIDGFGLVKIPIGKTEESITLITIAHPVTDSKYDWIIEKLKKRGDSI